METLNEIISVKALDNTRLQVAFDNGKEGVLDCVDYLAHPYWRKLNDPAFFSLVKVENGMLSWPGDVDMGEDDVYDAIGVQGGFATCSA